MATLDHAKASGRPSKEFFVSMLTRDITLDDCILDLVDNSIDGAWEQVDDEPNVLVSDDALGEFWVRIEVSADQFVITDNCGGITLDDAVNYAFTFGRRPEQEFDDFSVGVYGIGMKRAAFKIGQNIRVHSTYRDSGQSTSFVVPINVPEWLRRKPVPGLAELGADWDFDIEPAEPLPTPGVSIIIDDLHEDMSSRLGDETYPRYLRAILGRDYLVPLMRGLRITVNGVRVERKQFNFRHGDDLRPMRTRYEDGPVSVEIVAGMISPPPDDVEPNEADRDDISYGWYIVCNGRVVLAADTTAQTGWGDQLPRWHRQYSGFVGFALFSAQRASDLPMTTTKRNVDLSAGVYRRAVARMYEPARTWVSYTNARKADLDAAKRAEAKATAASITAVSTSPTVALPRTKTPATRIKVGNMNFARPLEEIQALAEALGDINMTYRDVGIKSFEYAYEELVGDD